MGSHETARVRSSKPADAGIGKTQGELRVGSAEVSLRFRVQGLGFWVSGLGLSRV